MKNTTLLLSGILCLLAWQGKAQPAGQPDPCKGKRYSVLSSGPTLKVSVTQDGVYKIRYEDLLAQGLVSEPVQEEKLAIYGNRSGALPYFNDEGIYDDLAHLPFSIHNPEQDGMFGPGDFLLFYGQCQHRFEYAPSSRPAFSLTKNPYSDTTYYFVGTHAEYQASIPLTASSGSPAVTVTEFPERILHETDRHNLCNGGMNWFGEQFLGNGASLSLSLPCQGAVTGRTATLFVQTAAQTSSGSASFQIQIAGKSFSIGHSSITSSACSDIRSGLFEFPLSGEQVTAEFRYSKSSAASNGYLDRVILHYARSLSLESGSLNFRSPEAVGADALFRISSPLSLRVWDVSDIYQIREIALASGQGTHSFSTRADSLLHEYVAFDPASCPAPGFAGIVQPQNLHEASRIDYVIISHPAFFQQARQIALLHEERHRYKTLAVTTDEVYNEYSSGSKDPSAFRLLLRSLKSRSDSLHAPRYLCLLGAASYDYRNLSGQVTDFVPTVQSFDNRAEGGGDPLDENFGYLDDNEGISPADNRRNGTLDVAVGRLPVRTAAEAEAVLEKIDIYSNPSPDGDKTSALTTGNFGDWRNEAVFVTDDSFEHSMEQNILKDGGFADSRPEFHLDKLYSDAYARTSSSTSTRVPELENDIRSKFEDGSFFIGYLGHSGWDAWSDERILTNNIIDNLGTSHAFPIVTASSCTFAYFDQIGQPSGAERLVLKKEGGAIAVMATARTALVGAIEDIHSRFLYALTDKSSGKTPTIGDAFLLAKTRNTQDAGHKFVLLGDPGLQAALPEHHVKTLKINGKPVDDPHQDTLKALSAISIEGCITDAQGETLHGFNGQVIAKIYDKPMTSKTLGLYNSREGVYNPVVSFTEQNSLIFQGTTQVSDGHFQFSFIVPKDIQYDYGFGKISYYAYSENSDANGSYSGLLVGGFNHQAVLDTSPPVVRLYIDDPGYRGQTVGPDPVLYAQISDQFGINTTGSGIGHDLTLVIDGNQSEPIVVNHLFRYDMGSYKTGSLSYPLDLEPGCHTAQLKVWNINNISATATIAFRIDGSDETKIHDFIAAPNPNNGQYVDFYFTHNGEGGAIDHCQFQLFNLQGACIARTEYDLDSHGGHSVGPLRWDFSRIGTRLQAGIYICQMQATGKNGEIARGTVKIVVTNTR